jgi:hypothetical protein
MMPVLQLDEAQLRRREHHEIDGIDVAGVGSCEGADVGAAKIFPGDFHVSRSALSFLARQLVAASEGIFRLVGPKAKTPHRQGASALMVVGCARDAIGRRRQR